MTDRSFLASVALAIGVAICGGFVGCGFARRRTADRYVEVKGLAEREATADLALWPLRFVASGSDLATAQTQITRSYDLVLDFLERHGIEASATHLQNLHVSAPTPISISAFGWSRLCSICSNERPASTRSMILPSVTNLRELYHEFPSRFWIVVGVHFIDKIGATLVFPFFALYITDRFNVGLTEAGILLGVLSLAGILGSVVGGGLTARLGRRKLILFGLLASALSALLLGSVNEYTWLFPVAALVGLFSEVGGPAHAAMIADIKVGAQPRFAARATRPERAALAMKAEHG